MEKKIKELEEKVLTLESTVSVLVGELECIKNKPVKNPTIKK